MVDLNTHPDSTAITTPQPPSPRISNGNDRRAQLVYDSETSEPEDENIEYIDPDENLLDDLPSDITNIDLIQLRIHSIPALNLDRFESLEYFCLRENLIQDIEGLEAIGPHLKELDLYDNRISHIENLGPEQGDGVWKALENLDLSFNKIKKIRHVNHLQNLKNLYFVQNKISKIENLDCLNQLVNLELGGNRIRVLENLDGFSSLKQLWVGKNKITKLQGLDKLKQLEILSIQANRITKLEGLQALESLEELYISNNGIEKIEGLEQNHKLRVLDLSSNRVCHVENLSGLISLQEFWASSNKLESFEELEHELANLANLDTVYFEGNPLETKNRLTYRNKIRLALGPGIKQIDATPVTGGIEGINGLQ
ncbi:hypothetical protein V1514DRAFT_362615 [Lipomyces japonicus]|uniref:uncharacterized protein n=1 Tax=Lipomyces japonicus TaxID=56871 RepID=UPI0034CF80F6